MFWILLKAVWASTNCLKLKDEVKNTCYIVKIGLGDYLGKIYSKSGDCVKRKHQVQNGHLMVYIIKLTGFLS